MAAAAAAALQCLSSSTAASPRCLSLSTAASPRCLSSSTAVARRSNSGNESFQDQVYAIEIGIIVGGSAGCLLFLRHTSGDVGRRAHSPGTYDNAKHNVRTVTPSAAVRAGRCSEPDLDRLSSLYTRQWRPPPGIVEPLKASNSVRTTVHL